jgi:LysR family transcriptional activator of glutamate synthase operon
MDFERLHEFVIIAEKSSFTEAAKCLAVNPATLSRRQKSFANHLGFPLFAYDHGQLRLTKEAENFYPEAVKACQSYDTLSESLHNIATEHRTMLKIAIAGEGMPRFLQTFLINWNLVHPEIHFKIFDETQHELQRGLREHLIDFYLAPSDQPLQATDLVQINLMTTTPQVLLPADHVLAAQKRIALTQLKNEQFILYPTTKNNLIRDFQNHLLKAAHFETRPYRQISTLLFYNDLVAMKKGVLLYPMAFTQVPAGCVARPLTGISQRPNYALFTTKAPYSEAAKTFIEELSRFLRKE